MDYQIMQQVGGKDFVPVLKQETKEPLIYGSSAEATAAAKELVKLMGGKFQPRPVLSTAGDWKAREQKRFADGHYKPTTWIGQEWFDKNYSKDHFLHISVKDPTRVAFTKSDRDGAADVQTSMKPGKYLTEFFGKVLTAEQIRTFAMNHATTFENKELKFATTPEDIERVYKPSLGSSCFSGTKKANLYGSGDFAVAYIENDKGEIKARSVCCPARKIYIHPYGDRERIRSLLTEAGYHEGGYNRTEWIGLKLLTKHYWNGFYTDFGCYPKPGPDDKEFFTIK